MAFFEKSDNKYNDNDKKDSIRISIPATVKGEVSLIAPISIHEILAVHHICNNSKSVFMVQACSRMSHPKVF